jgi:hypothetical protein
MSDGPGDLYRRFTWLEADNLFVVQVLELNVARQSMKLPGVMLASKPGLCKEMSGK